jgi:phage-related protein
LKRIEFCGSARVDLLGLPDEARREAGWQIFQVQQCFDPDDWKPMDSVEPGVREIGIRDASGAFRVVYVAKFADAVYVLHCFQKKTQKTAPGDLSLIRRRYKELLIDSAIKYCQGAPSISAFFAEMGGNAMSLFSCRINRELNR